MPDLRGLLRLAWRAVRYELQLYRSLARWALRRRVVRHPDQVPVGYAQQVTPLLGLWIFASAVEVPVFHLILPWAGARNVVLGLSIWGLIWMVGLLASLRVHPHLMTPTALHVRHGPGVEVVVPWDAITHVRTDRREVGSSVRTLHEVTTAAGTDLHVTVGGETNVQAELRAGLRVRTPGGDAEITAISFFVDDPRGFVAAARERRIAVS